MSEIQQLLKNNVEIYPVTKGEAVIFDNNTTLADKLAEKQDVLVSGENIKTLRGQSIVGSGDIPIIDGANVLFYNGPCFDNGQEISCDPLDDEYTLSSLIRYYGRVTPRVNDLVLMFTNTILVVTKIDEIANGYVSVSKLKTIDLKGDIGPAGVTSAYVYVDNTIGIPSAQISVSNQVLTLVLSGIKGSTGNSGYSGAANELVVVNNLVDGGETAALSAEMGKQLNESIPHVTVITEAAYELLLQNETVDNTMFYFIYE